MLELILYDRKQQRRGLKRHQGLNPSGKEANGKSPQFNVSESVGDGVPPTKRKKHDQRRHPVNWGVSLAHDTALPDKTWLGRTTTLGTRPHRAPLKDGDSSMRGFTHPITAFLGRGIGNRATLPNAGEGTRKEGGRVVAGTAPFANLVPARRTRGKVGSVPHLQIIFKGGARKQINVSV